MIPGKSHTMNMKEFTNCEWKMIAEDLEKVISTVDDPGFSDEEIQRIANNGDQNPSQTIFEVLCGRCHDNGHGNEEHALVADVIRTNAGRHPVPIIWDTLESFIGTVCEYDHSYLFANVDLLEGISVLINKDYLNRTLLAPRPQAEDIDRNTWHDMTMRMLGKADEIHQIREDADNAGITFPRIMLRALSGFINDNVEDLVFFETVSDLLGTFDRNARDTIYHPGMLESKPFDLLREYGAQFVKPLIEVDLERMRNKDKDTVTSLMDLLTHQQVAD